MPLSGLSGLPSELLGRIAEHLWLPLQRDLISLHEEFAKHQLGDAEPEEAHARLRLPDHTFALRLVSRALRDATHDAFARIFFRSLPLELGHTRSLSRINAVANDSKLREAVHQISLRPQRLSTLEQLYEVDMYYGCYVRGMKILPGIPYEFLSGISMADFNGDPYEGQVELCRLAIERQAEPDTATVVTALASAVAKLPNVKALELDCMNPYYRDDETLLPEVCFKVVDTILGYEQMTPFYSELELCREAFEAAGRDAPPLRSLAVWLQPGGFLDIRCHDMVQLCDDRPSEKFVAALSQAESLYIRSCASVGKPELQSAKAIRAMEILVSSDLLRSLTLHIGDNYLAFDNRSIERELFAVMLQRQSWRNLEEFRLIGSFDTPVHDVASLISRHANSLERVEIRKRPEQVYHHRHAMTDASKADEWKPLRSALVQCRRLRWLRVDVDVAGVEMQCETRSEVVGRLPSDSLGVS